MKTYNEFHDGWFEGVWIEPERAHVFLKTIEKDPFVIVGEGVVALEANDLKRGNIIFDVSIKTHEELTSGDVDTFPELKMIDTSKADVALERTRQRKLMLLEVNPSYGGSCVVLARSFELLNPKEWLERYPATSR